MVAADVLRICIRALDYCPPMDVTFGDYLRAIVTADSDLVPDDRVGYRIAFIEAFRRRGIYPRSVRTLSVESLRWPSAFRGRSPQEVETLGKSLKHHLSGLLQYAQSRADYAKQSSEAAKRVHKGIKESFANPASPLAGFITLEKGSKLEGITFGADGIPNFEIHSVRPAERVGPSGERVDQVVVVITQKRTVPIDSNSATSESEHFEFRGGATLIFDLATGELVYVIGKSILDEQRLAAQRAFIATGRLSDPSNTYAAPSVGRRLAEPFALLHRPAEEESP
jgi:hypothetical protein